MELISVIVPIYKVEKYLCRCVNSIINQTYKNLEIILVDDGSPDNSGLICDAYAKKDERIKVIHKENGGLSDARNAGLELAKGEYIGFVDSDDYLSSDMYEILYNRIKTDNTDMAVCDFYLVDEYGNNIEPGKPSNVPDEILNCEEALKKLMTDKKRYYVTAWNRLYSRKAISGIRFPVGKLHEDEYTAHHIFGNCSTVSCVGIPLYYYVQRSTGITGMNYSVNRFSDVIDAYIDRIKFANDYNNIPLMGSVLSSIATEYVKAMQFLDVNNLEVSQYLKKVKKMYNKYYKQIIFRHRNIKRNIKLILFYIYPPLLLGCNKYRIL